MDSYRRPGLWGGDIYRDDFAYRQQLIRERARLMLLQQTRQSRQEMTKLAEKSYEEGLHMARFFIEIDRDSEERLQDRALALYLDSVAAQSAINSAHLPYLPEHRVHATAIVPARVESPTTRQRSLEDRAFCMHLDRVAADYMKNSKLPRLLAAGYDRQKAGRTSAGHSNQSWSTYAGELPSSGETNEQISEDEEEKKEENE
ncbi:uncharacterized protein [Dermacentor albipictus]|uniref:uncharacterized protein isoform X2 n=1 Tax=Dermacentor albipictus TaxID=60249 RepID=UPI0038FC19C0